MKRGRNIVFLFLGLTIIVLLYYVFEQNKRYSWNQHYLQASKDPYGTLYFSEAVEKNQTQDSISLLSEAIQYALPLTEKPSNYVFVGEGMNFTDEDLNRLLDYVDQGNTAFIACRLLPDGLVEELYPVACDSSEWYGFSTEIDTTISMQLIHPSLQPDSSFTFTYYDQNGPSYYAWDFLHHRHLCDSLNGFTKLGILNDDLANFVRTPYGRGYFYLHTTPLAFTNISLLNRKGVDYSQLVLAHLEQGPVYWDEHSRINLYLAERLNNNNPFGKRLNSKSPLQYILSQPSLAWAWYILLLMGLLYLIFRAKRKQRIIPILEANTNTSLQFISTIGRLYFMQSNHKQLALQKMRLLQVFIKEKYNMNVREFDAEITDRLANRSAVAKDDILKIFEMHKNIASGNFVSENTLIAFHKAVEKFYHNCK